ncbi:uncharacterized protein LOC106167886 [Lingula anatina]|uniref:Uncharacterized protein LOC106167886 n=1 Tax=Lingula anatina TaxID=7574 RepID=A0A1S3IXG2_LINAN|nr:uncharacterized protein LOC106167886 [Lingula anatina]|eukprot:XP_013402234.1 uncharacterized protein LOC106167886 [Lingula anatina]
MSHNYVYASRLLLGCYIACLTSNTGCNSKADKMSKSAVKSNLLKAHALDGFTKRHFPNDFAPGYSSMDRFVLPIKISDLMAKMKETKSYHDVIRIFLGDDLSNREIQDMLTGKSQEHVTVKLRHGLGIETVNDIGSDHEAHKLNSADLKAAYEHYREVHSAPVSCSTPIAEVIKINKINTNPHKAYIPDCTVVYRCRREAGCCTASSQCGPKRKKNITRAFYVVGLEREYTFHIPWVETLTFENHTECGCIPIKTLPSCKKCPRPFVLRRNHVAVDQCDCQCRDGARECKRISRGKKPLEENQLSCIKRRDCYTPPCQFGNFDIKSGYCPERTAILEEHEEIEVEETASGQTVEVISRGELVLTNGQEVSISRRSVGT